MASSASSQLDSLFADMQVHALDVNDGFAKLKTALTAESLATVMGPVDHDLMSSDRQESTVKWLKTDATLKAILNPMMRTMQAKLLTCASHSSF